MSNKRTKVLYIQVILMYLCQLPLYIAFGLLFSGVDNELGNDLLLTGIILCMLLFVVYVVSGAIGLVNGFKFTKNPIKDTLITKLALIPWFAFNFVFCVILVAGFLNPFLMFGIPFVVGICLFFSYLAMISTSAHSISYVLNSIWKAKKMPNAVTIISIVFLFIFILDDVGIILLYLEDKKNISVDC